MSGPAFPPEGRTCGPYLRKRERAILLPPLGKSNGPLLVDAGILPARVVSHSDSLRSWASSPLPAGPCENGSEFPSLVRAARLYLKI
jgi:hypothetical protein